MTDLFSVLTVNDYRVACSDVEDRRIAAELLGNKLTSGEIVAIVFNSIRRTQKTANALARLSI